MSKLTYWMIEQNDCADAWVKLERDKDDDVIYVDSSMSPALTPSQALNMAATLSQMATDIINGERGEG